MVGPPLPARHGVPSATPGSCLPQEPQQLWKGKLRRGEVELRGEGLIRIEVGMGMLLEGLP